METTEKRRRPVRDPRVVGMVIDRHKEDRPRTTQYDSWCESVGQEVGIKPAEVREIVGRYYDQYEIELRHSIRTHAQGVADMIGLDQTEIVKTIKAGLRAEETVAMMDKGTGEIKTLKKPDNRSRLVAAKLGMELHGMQAPEQLHVAHDHKHAVILMTKEQIAEGFEKLNAEKRRLGLLTA